MSGAKNQHTHLIQCTLIQGRHEGLFQSPVGHAEGQAVSTAVEPSSGVPGLTFCVTIARPSPSWAQFLCAGAGVQDCTYDRQEKQHPSSQACPPHGYRHPDRDEDAVSAPERMPPSDSPWPVAALCGQWAN